MMQSHGNSPSVSFFTKFIATGLFSGYVPIAPGTAGSFVGLLLYMIPGMEAPLTLGVVTVVIFFAGIVASKQMEKTFGEDPSIVVIDEVVGMWISLLFLPKGMWIALLAFLFFRIFDIFKPPPARQLEPLKNGWGIMLDDVVAGVYANIAVQIILYFIPKLAA